MRQWTSAQAPAKIDLSKIGSAPEWIEQATPLAISKGMHRFIWSLHYPSATDIKEPYADGIWAPPGRYSAELTVDGQTHTQSFTVVADPRINLPDSAYKASFALARKIETLQVQVGKASEEAGALRKSLVEKRTSKMGAVNRKKLDAFETRLNAIAGSTPAANPFNAWSVPPKSIQSLTWLDRALGQLLTAVDGADAAPSPDSEAGYKKLAALVEQTLDRWKQFDEDSKRASAPM